MWGRPCEGEYRLFKQAIALKYTDIKSEEAKKQKFSNNVQNSNKCGSVLVFSIMYSSHFSNKALPFLQPTTQVIYLLF